MIAIIDYGMGNLRSVQKAFESVGANAIVSDCPADIEKADKIVLPGVGAIKPAIEKLAKKNVIASIHSSISQKKPFLGICLGMQLLFKESREGGNVPGLNIIPGCVHRFSGVKIPHMGWNQIHIKNKNCRLFNGLNDNFNAYFCHSYYVLPDEESTLSTLTFYGINFASSIYKENIFGVQFHPEKSQDAGLQILKNFSSLQ